MQSQPSTHHLPAPPKNALVAFGKMLTLSRKEHRWRQTDLAERIGVSRQTVSRLESGDPNVAIGFYFAAAWLLDLPIFPGVDSRSSPSYRALSQLFEILKDKYPQRVTQSRKKVDDNF